MALSMNARLPIPRLAKLAGLSEQATHTRVKILEEKLGIKYLLETNLESLGYITYLVTIKFQDNIPTSKEIEETIMDENHIIFAATTKGEYDILMYLIDEDPASANEHFVRLRYKEPLIKYKAIWNFGYITKSLSFVPLNETFIENILKNKIGSKSKDIFQSHTGSLKHREFLLLKELNSDSKVSFSDIDKKYNLNKGTSRYAYHNLKNKGLIVRPTISMTKAVAKYTGILQIYNIDYEKIRANRYKFLLDLNEHGSVVDRCCLAGNIGSPNGAMGLFPLSYDFELEKTAERVKDELQGSIVNTLIITGIIKGELCYRRTDSTYTKNYKVLTEMGKVTNKTQINYN